MLRQLTTAHYLSITALILTVFGILFGNNIADRFQKAELFYNIQDVEVMFPDFVLKEGNTNKKDSISCYYREVTIKNVRGKASNNLKLIMDVNGNILQHKITCIEDINVSIVENTKIEIKLDRLVPMAEVVCKFWCRQKPGAINIKYVDDNGFNVVKILDEKNDTHYLRFVAIVFFILLCLIITYSFYISPIKEKNVSLTAQNIDLQEKYDLAASELEQFKAIQEEADKPTDVILELEKILELHKKKIL